MATKGFNPSDDFTVPHQLRTAGLSQVEWNVWVAELRKISSILRPKKRDYAMSILSLPFSPLRVGLARRRKLWNKALIDWQKRFNEDCLENIGIFCKTRTFAARVEYHFVDATSGRKDKIPIIYRKEVCSEYFSWLEFAFTADGIETLKRTPHVEGYESDWGCVCSAEDWCMIPTSWSEIVQRHISHGALIPDVHRRVFGWKCINLRDRNMQSSQCPVAKKLHKLSQ